MLLILHLTWLVDMPYTSPFISSQTGYSGEVNLVDDLVTEQINLYGLDLLYMPRKMLNLDKLLHESTKNAFEIALPMPMYLKTFDGYDNGMELLTKFGVRSADQITFVMSRSEFTTYYGPFMKEYYESINDGGALNNDEGQTDQRPKEGDLIYFPFDDGIFEIKYVMFDQPFFQLGRGYVYELMCEKFEFSGESFETGYEEIDQAKTVPDYYRMEFDMESGSGTFVPGERVEITDFTNLIDLTNEEFEGLTTEQRDQLVVDEVFRLYKDEGYLEHVEQVLATVMDWREPDKELVVADLTNLDPDQVDKSDYYVDINKFDTVIIKGTKSGAVWTSLKAGEHETAFNDNQIIQDEFDDIKIIDDPWDENPFGFV